jgi:hypothetical protein
MKTIIKPTVLFLYNIILPFILCFLVTYILILKIIISVPANLLPFGFGIVIGVFNYNYYKYKIYFLNVLQVVIICIIISYLCFYFSLLLFPILSLFFQYILELLEMSYSKERYNFLYIPITVNFIAPYSLFFAHKFIFNFPKTKFTKVSILTFLILFPISGFF